STLSRLGFALWAGRSSLRRVTKRTFTELFYPAEFGGRAIIRWIPVTRPVTVVHYSLGVVSRPFANPARNTPRPTRHIVRRLLAALARYPLHQPRNYTFRR